MKKVKILAALRRHTNDIQMNGRGVIWAKFGKKTLTARPTTFTLDYCEFAVKQGVWVERFNSLDAAIRAARGCEASWAWEAEVVLRCNVRYYDNRPCVECRFGGKVIQARQPDLAALALEFIREPSSVSAFIILDWLAEYGNPETAAAVAEFRERACEKAVSP